jgi:type VI secretion system protein ImpA
VIKQIPLARSSKGEPYSLLHWEDAARLDNLARQNQHEAVQAELADGKVTTEQLQTAVSVIPRSFYETLFEDLQQCRGQYEQLAQVSDTNFGRSLQSLLKIKETLEHCYDIVAPIRKSKREREGLKDEEIKPKTVVATTNTATPQLNIAAPVLVTPALSGSVPFEPQSREDALLRLQAVASYFRRTEPHSPVSYLVQRAARWGAMPLEKWLREVVKDEGVLGSIWETLGLGAAADNGEASGEGSGGSGAES